MRVSEPEIDENGGAQAWESLDRLERATSRDLHLRALAAVTSGLVREACERHELTGAAAIALGRALTASCLMATLTKQRDERLRIELRGDGALGSILIDAHGDGRTRGCLPRRASLPTPLPAAGPATGGRATVGEFVGRAGTVVVTRDVGLEHEYQGVVALRSGEVDEDLEHYLTSSEQLPSALGCAVILDRAGRPLRAGGVLCQTFPGGDATDIERLRESLRSGTLQQLLSRHERTTSELIGYALAGQEHESMGVSALRFHCHCGRDTARSVVSTLGAEDIDALAGEAGRTEVRCSYCGKSYELTASELRALATELRARRS